MKQQNLFFNGTLTEYFKGKTNLYIGDQDFVFADNMVSIIGELKTISIGNEFKGKKLSFNQAREYASKNNVIDNYGRTIKTFLFEYHKHVKKPYVIIIPFKTPTGKEKMAHQLIDLNNSHMVYVGKQLNEWFELGHKGIKPQKPLLCV